MKTPIWQKPVCFIIIATLVSWAINCILFPELLFFKDIRFYIPKYDYEFNYAATIILIQNWLHGGIHLWNRFDQLPFGTLQLLGGIYSADHIMTAISYYFVDKLIPIEDGASFFSFFVTSFYFINCAIRTAVGFILLRRFRLSPLVMLTSLVLLNTICTTHMLQGFGLVYLYTLFILTMHFALEFADNPVPKNMFLFFLSYVLVGASSPLFSLSYFYLGTHCFVASLIFWVSIYNKDKFCLNLNWLQQKYFWISFAVCSVVSVVIIFPSFWMLLHNWKDTYFAAEGSRFNDLFSISEYFKRDVFFAKQEFLLRNAFDYRTNDWGYSWIFLGFNTSMLALVGLVFSKNSQKWIFVSTGVLFILMNSERNSTGFNAFFHWFHALTSPFKFIPRSFHMTGNMMLPFVILPLTALGLQSAVDILKEKIINRRRLVCFVVLVLVATVIFFNTNPSAASRRYVLISLTITLLGSVLIYCARSRKWSFLVLTLSLLSIIVLDLAKTRTYFKIFKDETIALNKSNRIKYGNTKHEYKNPKILPYFSRINGSVCLNDDELFHVQGQAMSRGLLLGTTPIGRYFYPGTQYQPRHVAYKHLNENLKLIDFLKTSPPFVSLYFDTENGKMLKMETVAEAVSFRLSDARKRVRGDVVELIFKLPKNFSKWRSTSIYSADKEFCPIINFEGYEFRQHQGELNQPYLFEINSNIEDHMTFTLPANKLINPNSKAQLLYGRVIKNGLSEVITNTPDKFKFSFSTNVDGELLLLIPYDKKWNIKMDGSKVSFERGKDSFIKVKTLSGNHQVEMCYWPNTVLRELIIVSVLLSLLLLAFLFQAGVSTKYA